MEKVIKVLVLMNQQILITQIEEVGADIGEPDCKLIDPYLIIDNQINGQQKVLEPFLNGYTKQNNCMMNSDKILTLVDPTPTLLEKYQDLIKE